MFVFSFELDGASVANDFVLHRHDALFDGRLGFLRWRSHVRGVAVQWVHSIQR